MSLSNLFSKLKGGPGSGNHGHAGIPGQRGGSAPGGGGGGSSSSKLENLNFIIDKVSTPNRIKNVDKDGFEIVGSKAEKKETSTEVKGILRKNGFQRTGRSQGLQGMSITVYENGTDRITIGEGGKSYTVILDDGEEWD